MVLVTGEPELTESVRSALTGRHRVTEVPDLVEGLDRCHRSEVGLLVVVRPAQGLDLGRLRQLVDRGDPPAPLLGIVPAEHVGDRRALTAMRLRYLPAPLDARELLTVVEQLDGHRRRTRTWLGDVCIDHDLREVTRAGSLVPLTRREFDLLDALQHNRGIVLSKDQLLDAVWGSQAYNPNVVEVAISSLRRKLERIGPRIIKTVHGVGYVCVGEVDEGPPLHGLLERRRDLLAERQRLLAERDALRARARALRSADDEGLDDPADGAEVERA